MKIDFDGLAERVARVPVEADNITGLFVVKGYLLYSTAGAAFYGRDSYAKAALHIFDMKDRKASELVDDISGWAISADGSKVLVHQEQVVQALRRQAEGQGPEDRLHLGDVRGSRAERRSSSRSSTRSGGSTATSSTSRTCTATTGRRSGSATGRCCRTSAHRSDLNYVLGEMVAELNIGHTYIQGGDFQLPDRPKVALPGARFDLDEKAGRYRISKIFAGPERRGEVPRAAHRDRRGRQGRRLRPCDRRRGSERAPTTRTGCCATRPTR